MPLHMPAHNRRQFLTVLGAGIAAGPLAAFGADDKPVQDDLIYILNDTHIGEKHAPDSPIPTHLRQVVRELTELKRPPAAVVINGDLALYDGQPGDYRHFAKLIQPLRDAGIGLHLTLGNHDNREAFYEVLREERPEKPLVESRHLSVVETRFANLYLLDSLHETMVTPGTLGRDQLKFLAAALDARADKPAIIMTHHNPRLGGDPTHYPGGLTDSRELWDLLDRRRQVKAYIHGHVHDRTLAEHRGIHIVNTPATSYVARPDQSTTGWTIARLSRKGAVLTTRTTSAEHPWDGQSRSLTWRT